MACNHLYIRTCPCGSSALLDTQQSTTCWSVHVMPFSSFQTSSVACVTLLSTLPCPALPLPCRLLNCSLPSIACCLTLLGCKARAAKESRKDGVLWVQNGGLQVRGWLIAEHKHHLRQSCLRKHQRHAVLLCCAMHLISSSCRCHCPWLHGAGASTTQSRCGEHHRCATHLIYSCTGKVRNARTLRMCTLGTLAITLHTPVRSDVLPRRTSPRNRSVQTVSASPAPSTS